MIESRNVSRREAIRFNSSKYSSRDNFCNFCFLIILSQASPSHELSRTIDSPIVFVFIHSLILSPPKLALAAAVPQLEMTLPLRKKGVVNNIFRIPIFVGLLRDDCLYEDQDVEEALRRIPRHLVDERNYRLLRAIQLSIQKTILPKEEWTKCHEDVLYLSPMVNQVRREREEREKWESEY